MYSTKILKLLLVTQWRYSGYWELYVFFYLPYCIFYVTWFHEFFWIEFEYSIVIIGLLELTGLWIDPQQHEVLLGVLSVIYIPLLLAILVFFFVDMPEQLTNKILEFYQTRKNRKAREEQAIIDAKRKLEEKERNKKNALLVREEIKDAEKKLALAHDQTVAKNIEKAKKRYPKLRKTLEDEVAFLKDLSARHPNIAGFIETRSTSDLRKSPIVRLGRFLEKQS